jgi:hypothetical protein
MDLELEQTCKAFVLLQYSGQHRQISVKEIAQQLGISSSPDHKSHHVGATKT